MPNLTINNKSSTIKAAYNLYHAITEDLLLNPNLQERDILALADIGKALVVLKDMRKINGTEVVLQEYEFLGHIFRAHQPLKFKDQYGVEHQGSKAILKFLEAQQQVLLKVYQDLVKAKAEAEKAKAEAEKTEAEAKGEEYVEATIEYLGLEKPVTEGIKLFEHLLYQNPKINEENVAALSTDEKEGNDEVIILFRSPNGELAIRFQNEAKRDAALLKIGQTQIPAYFRKGKPYTSNTEGYTPFVYKQSKDTLFFPAYEAYNEEFAISTVEDHITKNLLEVLRVDKLEQDVQREHKRIIYAGLFAVYRWSFESKNAIYFNKNCKIFTEKGGYLRINLTKGTINNNAVWRPEPPQNQSASRAQNQPSFFTQDNQRTNIASSEQALQVIGGTKQPCIRWYASVNVLNEFLKLENEQPPSRPWAAPLRKSSDGKDYYIEFPTSQGRNTSGAYHAISNGGGFFHYALATNSQAIGEYLFNKWKEITIPPGIPATHRMDRGAVRFHYNFPIKGELVTTINYPILRPEPSQNPIASRVQSQSSFFVQDNQSTNIASSGQALQVIGGTEQPCIRWYASLDVLNKFLKLENEQPPSRPWAAPLQKSSDANGHYIEFPTTQDHYKNLGAFRDFNDQGLFYYALATNSDDLGYYLYKKWKEIEIPPGIPAPIPTHMRIGTVELHYNFPRNEELVATSDFQQQEPASNSLTSFSPAAS